MIKMTGTEKQIAWAESIISKVYANVDERIRQTALNLEMPAPDGLSEQNLIDMRNYLTEKLDILKEIRNAYDRLFAMPKYQIASSIIDSRNSLPTIDHILGSCEKYATQNNIPVIEACKIIYKK